ncbi:MAG: zinc ABC transporter substrate-binding protein [Alphaproteobacteria bacterium]|nr:zinc ABC transporter substrate-binding protein [Alphaproteobacteria bacterium]
MRSLKILIPLFLFLGIIYAWYHKQSSLKTDSSLSIVVTIKPIHSLVSAVAEGVLTPKLLMDRNASPHTHSLSPDEVQMLRKADLVVWVGEIYEAHMKQILEKTVPAPKIFTLSDKDGLILYPYRKESLWEGEFIEAHEHSHDCGCGTCDDDAHEGHDHHGHSHSSHSTDGHLWLDPQNAIIIVNEVSNVLSRIDPSHAAHYKNNAAKTIIEIKHLDDRLQERLRPIKGKPYLLYHDAMQYFDHHFGTKAIGAITIEPGHPPKAQHFMRLKALLGNKSSPFYPACIFTEPQFENDASINLAEQFSLRYHMLDYLGQDISSGPKAYFEIMNQMADDLLKGLS